MQSKALTFGKGKLLLAAAVIALVVAALVPGMAFAADYTVTFDSAGGSAVKSQTVAAGGKITKPTDPTRDNYTFAGWFKDGDFSSDSEFDFTAAINEDTTLVAKWSLKKDKVQTWRLYNKWSGEHLFTNDEAEYKKLGELGWTQEGKAWVSPKSSKVPVYRLYNPYSGDHHYTVNQDEYNYLGTIGWVKEYVSFYSYAKNSYTPDEGGAPVYRGFNPYEKIGTHHYTVDADEMKTMVKNGWRDEGIGWFYRPATS